MTNIRSRLLLVTTLASLSLTSLVQAQGGPPRPRDPQGAAGGMRRNGGQPVGAMGRGARGGDRFDAARGPRAGRGNPAAMLLGLRSQLQLTDEQVKRLEALQDTPAPAANAAGQLRARADLLEATQGDGNLAKARAALDRLSAMRNERMVAGLKQRQEVRAVLTATQKTRLDNLRAERRRAGVARPPRGPRGRGMGPGMGLGMGGRSGMGGPGMGTRRIRGGMGGGMDAGMRPGAPVPPTPQPPQ